MSTTKIFLGKKILPCVPLLVSYTMKKSNKAGKVNGFSKKTVYLKRYKRITLKLQEIQLFQKYYIKNIRNSLELYFWYPV